jgi:hypothetical protein
MSEISYTIIDGPVTLANGEILTEADFERMADEAEAFERVRSCSGQGWAALARCG